MLILDPIYFDCVRNGNSKRLRTLLYFTKDMQFGISPDQTFRIGCHNRPAINLAIEAGHSDVGKYIFTYSLITRNIIPMINP